LVVVVVCAFQVCGHLPVVLRKVGALLQSLAAEVPLVNNSGGTSSGMVSPPRPLPLATKATLHAASVAAASPGPASAPVAAVPSSFSNAIVSRLQKCVLRALVHCP
jgi:hypothetical protein